MIVGGRIQPHRPGDRRLVTAIAELCGGTFGRFVHLPLIATAPTMASGEFYSQRIVKRFVPAAFPSHEIAGAGLMVVRGGATRGEGLPPYLPFIEALGDYTAAVSVEVLREVVGTAGAVLAGLLPGLAERLGPAPTPLRLAPEEERLRLFEAMAVVVARTAQTAPVVRSLDDLQWADAATCELPL